jgi:predicted DNA-binding transcriptional regulator AlpA
MSDSNHNKPSLRLVRSPSEKLAEIPSDLVDEVALAVRLGVSRSTLQSWRYVGRGPRYLKIGRLIRYRNADIEAFLRASTRGAAA